MTDRDREARHSRALEPEIIADPQARAEAEAINGLRQYDLAVQIIHESIERQPFRLRLSTILSLHREALRGISSYAGNFRPGAVEIPGSLHEPVGAHLVAGLVEELCDDVNARWEDATPIHLAAYVMWRLDTSVCGREWSYVASSIVRRAVGQARRNSAGNSHLP